MKITVIGTGYVGLVNGVCFADLGNDVLCADIDHKKIEILDRGATPIFEPGLQERQQRAVKEGRLKFTTDLKKAIDYGDLIFICVGTPQKKDGSVDLKYIESVAKTIGDQIESEKIIIDKSTVPVGTAKQVRRIIKEQLQKRNHSIHFHVISNPEFLKEGAAVNDFFNADRTVIGIDNGDEAAKPIMEKLYASIARTERPIFFTNTATAELIKYASNAMLATRISFMNQLSHYAEAVGADISKVSKGMGLDNRIGSRFLQPGLGYGGSCFPKDVRGLIASMKETSSDASILVAVHEANEAQKRSIFKKITKTLNDLEGKKIALWGLAFKPKTDDIREAPSLAIVQWLLAQGAKVSAYDPEAAKNFSQEFPDVEIVKTPYDCLNDADCLILCTEWDEFRNPNWDKIGELMNTKLLIDGRNIYTQYREDFKRIGIKYECIGIPE